MPTYDYRCNKCGSRFEVFQSITAESAAPCPECNNPAERMIGTGMGLIFKGSGFYITDYKKNGHSAAATTGSKKSDKPEKPTKSDSGGTSETV